MKEPSTQTTPEDDPYSELLWGGDFDDRQEAELERKNQQAQTTQYADVLARLESATAASDDLDADIMVLTTPGIGLHWRNGDWWYDCSVGRGKVAVSAYTGSIDAALLLLPKSTDTVKIGATVWVYPNGRGEARLWCRVKDDDAEGGWAAGNVPGNPGLPANTGATPAIALCIAALKARQAELESVSNEPTV